MSAARQASEAECDMSWRRREPVPKLFDKNEDDETDAGDVATSRLRFSSRDVHNMDMDEALEESDDAAAASISHAPPPLRWRKRCLSRLISSESLLRSMRMPSEAALAFVSPMM